MAATTERHTQTDRGQAGRAARVIGAGGGAAFVVLILVGNGIAEEGGSPAVGVPLEFLGFVGLACFVAYIATSRWAGRRLAAALATVAGVMSLAVKVGSVAPYLAAQQFDLTQEVAAGLIATSDAAFVVNWLPHGLFVLAAAWTGMQARRLHPAIGWSGVVTGAATMVALTVSVSEPFVVPFVLSLAWILLASVAFLRHELRPDRAWSVEV